MVYIYRSSSFRTTRLGRANASGIAIVEHAQKQALKVDFVDTFGLWAQGDGLAHERLSDGTQTTLPLDLSVVTDTAHRPMAVVVKGSRSAIRPSAAPIESDGIVSVQRLMRTLGVVIAFPPLTAASLSEQASSRRARRVSFEFPMHLFMGAVVLRMARANELDLDAQGAPPHTQGRESPSACAAEGRAVVHADHLGQTEPAKQTHEHAAHRRKTLMRQNAQRQDKATEQIAHRQRIAARAIGRAEKPLEVHRPDIVGRGGLSQGGQRQGRTAPRVALAAGHGTKSGQPLGDRTDGGQTGARKLVAQAGVDFFCAPMREALTQTPHDSPPAQRSALRGTARATRTVEQARASILLEAMQPLVARAAADSENLTEHGERFELF